MIRGIQPRIRARIEGTLAAIQAIGGACGRLANTAQAGLRLRTKGFIGFAAVLLYVLLVAGIVSHHRGQLRLTVEEQRSIFEREEALSRVNTALAYAVLNVNDAYSTPNPRVTVDSVALDIEAVQAALQTLKGTYPATQPWVARLDEHIAVIRTNWARASLLELREALHELVGQLGELTSEIAVRRNKVYAQFQSTYDAITLAAVVLGLIGVVSVAALLSLFFSRLVADIRRLQERALAVVKGYRGTPLAITRHDELGALIQSVNDMQSDLRERENQLEIARQQRFHQEKMAAVGSLAAAIAHEVNNPIAAITGVAEAIEEVRESAACPVAHKLCRPELILEQTRRIREITRQLAEMTRPYSPDPQLIDLNELVRNTCAFITYDRRFRELELTMDLDPQLPAVTAVADHLTQVLMNLLINAADATREVPGRNPTLRVETRALNGGVLVTLIDNGCGMSRATLARAFEQGFTTKPQGNGSGLGLFMCRSLVSAEGGTIDLQSEPDRGTRASIFLPSPQSKAVA
ncbi:MAG TPA: HAMP domain-containing sensor histidine kinase [Burkholderiales bacterium]|nr:HAMP domain-containing sensor histidine kinase [Burkholderiales bacterium]